MSHHQNQRQQFNMVGGGNYSNNYGGRYHHDTTYTKIFVGGLAWETQRDTMKQYFEQFGEILEAVVISDKTSGRSKGYGFVTFREPEAAYRACENPSPVIDGRRANCNLASLGAQKNRSPIPQHVAGGGRFRGSPGLMNVPAYATSPSSSPYFQPAASAQPPPFPYSSYGFTGYAHDTMYPMNYYGGVYGQQFSPYYLPSPTTGAGVGSSSTQGSIGYFHNFYPYYPSYPQPQGTSHGPSTYGVQYPPMVQQYPLLTHQPNSSSAGILTLPTSTTIATPTPSTTTTAATTIASTATTIASTTTTTVNASGVGSTSTVGVVVSAGSGDSDDVKTGATSEQN